MNTNNQSSTTIEEIPIKDIRLRFRLRTPKDSKIQELAESIKLLGLMNPITIDSQNYLIAGFHRYGAIQLLGYDTISAIRKDTTSIQGELMEIDENLKRNELNHIEIAEHMVRREELLEQLGVRMKRGGNQYTEGMVTTTDLAEEVGMSNRIYRLKRQPSKITEEARDLIRDTKFAENLMDMVKLSQQDPQLQLDIVNLLITGQCQTFKRAFVEASMTTYNSTRELKIDFDLIGRWGMPKSIMTFKKADVELQKVCDLISKDPELELIKRPSVHFGTSTIPLYGMAADHAEFLVTYYTPEGGLILDNFMGRGTIGLATLWHGRRFIGYDVVPGNVDAFTKVVNKHFPTMGENYQVFNSDGITLEELADKENYLDAVITDPPYVCNAERYSKEEKDISSLNHKGYMDAIHTNLKNLYRLIKTSNFEEKKFYPVIIKVGTGRKGAQGIIDMDADFQYLARQCGFVLWDKLFNQLSSPFAQLNWERNYVNRYTQKNYETNLVFCKFK